MICRNHVDVSEGIRRCGRCGATFCRDCLVDIGGVPYCATCKTEQLLDARSGVQRTALDIAQAGTPARRNRATSGIPPKESLITLLQELGTTNAN